MPLWYETHLEWKISKRDICKCLSGEFFYIRGNERKCYKCDNEDKGKPGCYHCEYFPANDELDCEECDILILKNNVCLVKKEQIIVMNVILTKN